MQLTKSLLLALATAGLASAQETVLGVYIFSRHGDRSAKSTPPANLTDLGYEEVFTSGTYFRDRYIAQGASFRIHGINSDLVKLSQLAASAPLDNVLLPSAQGFLQGLYPPVGNTLGSNILRNGTTVQSPLNGYQLIPISVVSTGAGSEDSAWLQGSTNCLNAQVSSNDYYTSTQYLDTLAASQPLYDTIAPMVNKTFAASAISFANAYTIWDLLNVAQIHNSTESTNLSLLTTDVFNQLFDLANEHEFNLAYNASEPIRAVTGSIVAAEVLQALNGTITGQGKLKMNIQFGAYAGFQSYFGLANLTSVNPDFYGIPDYSSTLTWELVTNASTANGSWPTNDEISVRFLFHNGTTSNISEPVAYPLFGQSETLLPWNDFVTYTNMFAIGTQSQWCEACGNSTGVCAAATATNSSSTGSTNSSASGSGHGMSLAVAGVIGAMVTLGVILGVEGLIMLIGGLKLVSKKSLASGSNVSPTGSAVKA